MDRTPTATHCPYCALQCGMILTPNQSGVQVNGNETFPVNNGGLCVKGWNAAEPLTHPDRLTTPLVRDAAGVLRPASWAQAVARIAERFRAAQAEFGPDAVGVFGSGALTNEKAYLLGKFARTVLRTRHIDYNGRFCMSSAAAAAMRAFGIDRGLPFPVADIADTDVLLLVGANPAETMPPLMQYVQRLRERGGQVIVADPRATATAAAATLHLHLRPGTDTALANGLLHLLVREGAIDQAYIDARTEGFEAVRQAVAAYWPERVERLTGVPEAHLVRAARMLAGAQRVMVLTARGAEQQSHGVENALGFINVALALGMPGKPAAGWGCLTGQGNGQGGREHGQKADQLPGYRSINDPAARALVAAAWGGAEADLPAAGVSAYELLDAIGEPGGVRALWVMGSNLAVSAPRLRRVADRLAALDFLVVSDFFLSETAELADVVLPVAQWAEEEGTTTNLEGRVLLRRKAQEPPAGVRTDLEALQAVAAALGAPEGFAQPTTEAVFDELCSLTSGGSADYAGISYRRLAETSGVYWPCPAAEHPGTPRLFADRFPTPTGRARFYAVEYRGAAEEPDAEFPLYLTTGRVLAQYQTGTQTRRVAKLRDLAPAPQVEVHPALAARLDLRDGAAALLESRRGAVELTVRLSTAIREDTVFVPFHWGGAQAVNLLTNPALDPTSRMPEFKVCAVRMSAAAGKEAVHA